MERVAIFGPGAAGKSTLAAKIGSLTGIPVTELDKLFWRPGLLPTPRDEWTDAQRVLVSERRWILDGDLGPYDAVEVRLGAADTVILLDYSILRCAWRAMRRSRERMDFWLWLLQYRRRSRPHLLKAISEHAPLATVHRFRNPRATDRFVAGLARARRRE